MNDWKQRLGMVFSTNPDFEYTTTEEQEATTEATEPAENIVEGAQEGTIVAAEDNLSEQSALSSDEQTE